MQNINYSTLKEKDSNKTTKVRDCPPRDKQKKPRGFDPALPHRCSTIGTQGLNFSVRNG